MPALSGKRETNARLGALMIGVHFRKARSKQSRRAVVSSQRNPAELLPAYRSSPPFPQVSRGRVGLITEILLSLDAATAAAVSSSPVHLVLSLPTFRCAISRGSSASSLTSATTVWPRVHRRRLALAVSSSRARSRSIARFLLPPPRRRRNRHSPNIMPRITVESETVAKRKRAERSARAHAKLRIDAFVELSFATRCPIN